MHPHTRQGSMDCLPWHITPVTIIKMICHLSHSSPSVGLYQTGQHSFPSHIGKSWLPNLLLSVCCFSILILLSVANHHGWPWVAHKPCSFGDALIQPSGHEDLTFVRVTQIFTPAHFWCIWHVNYEYWMLACHLIYPKLSHALFLFASRRGNHNVLATLCTSLIYANNFLEIYVLKIYFLILLVVLSPG